LTEFEFVVNNPEFEGGDDDGYQSKFAEKEKPMSSQERKLAKY